MSLVRSLIAGIILNLLFVLLLFEVRDVLVGNYFTIALILLMAVSAWAAARVSDSLKILAGIGTVIPIAVYFTYVSVVFFGDFSLIHASIVLMILGAGLCGTYIALWQTRKTKVKTADR